MTNGQEEEKKCLNKSEHQSNRGFDAMIDYISGDKKKFNTWQWNFFIFGKKISIEIAPRTNHT